MNALQSLALMLAVATPGAGDDPFPGRDGDYQFESASLVGTVWEGRIVFDDLSIIRFDRNGVLRIRYFNQLNLQANWRQNGGTIIIEINNKYVECEGRMRNDRLVGTAKNKANSNWVWELTRKAPSAGNIFGAMP
jgi:hypothetical protein